VESLLTALLDAKSTKYPQTVNRAVSFNAIKNHALALLLSEKDTDALLEKLTALFLNPCLDRSHRNPPCKNSSSKVLLNFQRRHKKHCF